MDAPCSAMSNLSDPEEPEGFKIEMSKNRQFASKMFIGGIPHDVSKQDLYEYLSQFGQILDFTIKNHPISGKPRGFGFVLFKDTDTVEKVLQVEEHKVCGKKIDIKRANVIETKYRPRKVFVGGLNPQIPEEEIREYFGIFGEIKNIELPVCPRTNKRRAYCLILYAEETAVKKVLEKEYHYIGSSRCVVKLAFKSGKPQKPTKKSAPSSGEGNPEGGNPEGDSELHANSNASRVDQNVPGAVGGGAMPARVLDPVPSTASSQVFAFPAARYCSFYNVHTNQPVFNAYSQQYFLGYNPGAYSIGTVCPYCNAYINPAAIIYIGSPTYQFF